MRKKWIFTALVLVILALISIFPFFTTHTNVVINAPIDEVSNQFNKTINLVKWYPGFSEEKLSLTVINPAAVAIRKSGARFSPISVFAAESVNNGMSTRLNMEKRTNGLTWIIDKSSGENTILQHFKSYMENDSLRYGFPISVIPVTDTLILTTRTITTASQLQETVNSLRNQLMQFVSQRNIPVQKEYYFVSSIKTSAKEVEVAVGIPVTSIEGGHPGYEFLKLPRTGRLLSLTYKGKYEEKNQLYATLDKYILDKRLKKVAQPLEKYNFADTLFNAHKNINITLYYPIY